MVQLQIELPEHFLDEEVRCGYTVTKQIKELWAVQLDILVQIQQICEKHNIKYYADSGTLLGAIRHKGFIPWDDDIDISMDRRNFELFSKYAKMELIEPYFFQTEETEHGSLRLMGKVFNSNTTAILKIEKNRGFKFNQGIFVDIFCFDNIPDDLSERNKFCEKLDTLRAKAKKLNQKTYRYNPKLDKKGIKRLLKTLFAGIYTKLNIPNFYYLKLKKLCEKYNFIKTKEFGSLMFKDDHEPIQLRADYETLIKVPFEFLLIDVPQNYEKVLDKFYSNWREFEIGTSHHGELIIDTDKSYTKYLFTKFLQEKYNEK